MEPVGVAIGMGSNLGDRAANLSFGRERLRRVLDEAAFSSLYESAPRHRLDQPPFLNACGIGRTRLTPCQLLAELQHLEQLAGRRPGGPRYGPRPLDLDLLLYGARVIAEPDLMVPHPRMRQRGFVLVPLAELVPDWKIPGSGGASEATVAECAARVDRSGVERTELDWRPNG